FVGGDHPKELRIPVRSGHPEPLLRRRPDSDAQHDRYRFDRGSHAVLGDVLMNALARRLRQGRDQAGFTVLEVAVTTLILGIVLGIAYGFLVQTQSVESRSTNDAQLEKLAQIAERTLSEDVRGADPISAACGSTTDAASPALPTSYSSCVSFSVVRNTSGLVGCPKSAFVYALV